MNLRKEPDTYETLTIKEFRDYHKSNEKEETFYIAIDGVSSGPWVLIHHRPESFDGVATILWSNVRKYNQFLMPKCDCFEEVFSKLATEFDDYQIKLFVCKNQRHVSSLINDVQKGLSYEPTS